MKKPLACAKRFFYVFAQKNFASVQRMIPPKYLRLTESWDATHPVEITPRVQDH